MARLRVYLAGSLLSNWQDAIRTRLVNVEFYNPRTHGLENSKQCTVWDFHYIKQCDVLFAYMEQDNPSGYGLSVELGYAKGLGKTVILVDERSMVDSRFAKHFVIVREAADLVFESIEEGINYLQRLAVGS